MAVLKKDEILNKIKGIIGDNTDDESISLIEDVTDTIGDYETRLSDTTDWKQKYEENDNNWRTKYKERFFSGKSKEDEKEENEENDDKPKTYSYDSLFETK